MSFFGPTGQIGRNIMDIPEFVDASRYMDGKLGLFEEFVRQFSKPDVQTAVRTAAQELFGYDDDRAHDFVEQAAGLTAMLDDIDKRGQLTLYVVVSLQSMLIRRLTQLALEMGSKAIPHQLVPTAEDLYALKTVADFSSRPFTETQRMRDSE